MVHKVKQELALSSKYNRNFSEEFKKIKVKELEKGILKITELCKIYEVSRTSVYKWIYLYSKIERGTKTVLQMDSEKTKTLQLLQKISELERVIGQKQLEIDYLNKSFEIASNEIGYDLKKKYEQK
jgi:transposase